MHKNQKNPINTLSPDPTTVGSLNIELLQRLRDSFNHLLFEVGPANSLRKPLKHLINREFRNPNKLPKSILFAAHSAILKAALVDDKSAFTHACNQMLLLPLEKFETRELRTWTFSEETLGIETIALLRQSYLDDIGLTSDLIPPNESEIESSTRLIREATNLMHRYAPLWFDEFKLLVSDIFLAVNMSEGKKGFGGASAFDAYGSILLNPQSQESAITTLMTLIHESSHSRLFLHHLDDPILLNDGNMTYRSPLRTDPRPMEGIFHAAWVSARMTLAAKELLDHGISGEDALNLTSQMYQSKKIFEDCIIPIKENAIFTPLGEKIYKDAEMAINNV